MFGEAGKRAETLALRLQGRSVFDPTILANEYRKTRTLANFIGHDYAPLKAAKGNSATASVLAFAALLLSSGDGISAWPSLTSPGLSRRLEAQIRPGQPSWVLTLSMTMKLGKY